MQFLIRKVSLVTWLEAAFHPQCEVKVYDDVQTASGMKDAPLFRYR
jgi:hypothetical protein